ncbi:MAG: hypothetical protein CML17_02420 [Pusillimonas sp.]|nr:hypothetical protein [Pusillimonas sp.]|tara:strand:+ start:13263 stop:14021 length:759 start_codon:yes stop_codon:yes gene_type:complete
MKIALLDEQGNVVTPRKGDCVMACDIENEEMHNAIRDAFANAGCKVFEHGKYNAISDWKYLAWLNSSFSYRDRGCLSWSDDNEGYRRLYPHAIKQTLFEAAKDAADGTRFKVGQAIFKVHHGSLMWIDGDELRPALLNVLGATNWEYVPDGPKKRDVRQGQIVGEDSVYIPADMMAECIDAFKLIGRLAMWEGAQIGKPGYAKSCILISHGDDKVGANGVMYIDNPLPLHVTFETKEQCEAAWKAECPEMFE